MPWRPQTFWPKVLTLPWGPRFDSLGTFLVRTRERRKKPPPVRSSRPLASPSKVYEAPADSGPTLAARSADQLRRLASSTRRGRASPSLSDSPSAGRGKEPDPLEFFGISAPNGLALEIK